MWTEKLRATARRLLEENRVARVLAYAEGMDPAAPFPHLAADPDQANRLVLNAFCAPNLAKYLLEYTDQEGSTAVVLKGCDWLGLERLIQDHRVEREKVHVLGLPCPGMLDKKKLSRVFPEVREAALRDGGVEMWAGERKRTARREDVCLGRCLACRVPTPAAAAEFLGEPLAPAVAQPDFAAVEEIEKRPTEERRDYWTEQFSRCLRCLACRQVCPACNCRSCSLDSEAPRWLSRATGPSANQMFHFIRAWDVAGRCVDCQECERVCPMDIPLMRLNRKLMRDVGELFAIPDAHVPRDAEPLGIFRPDDPEEFE